MSFALCRWAAASAIAERDTVARQWIHKISITYLLQSSQ